MLSDVSPKECKLVRFVIRLLTSSQVFYAPYAERASLSALPSFEEKILVTDNNIIKSQNRVKYLLLRLSCFPSIQ